MQSISNFLVCCILTIGAGDIDFDYLLDQYVLICGNMLCNKTSEFIPEIPAYFSTCSGCSCNENCVFNGTCCPDKFFSLKLACTNTSIVSHKTESKDVFEDSFLMRVTCPEATDPLSKANCESNKTFSEIIQYLPVTSSETNITYKNKFCAQCNNESKFEQWIFNSVCDEFVDFNFISSIDELFKTAIDKKCKISSNLTGLNTAGCFRVFGYNTIKTCNVSGSWITYNKDIEWACLNYNNRFVEFKNVFCYICNPPVKVEEVITDCNITGKLFWYDDYPNFQAACKALGQSTATYPFKNIYCYLCNSIPSRAYINGRRVIMYFDASVSIEEKVVNGKYFEYIFEIDSFNGEFMDSYLKTQAYQYSETQLMTNHRVNLTEIYTYYYAMTGNGHFCVNISTNVISDERHYCGCSDGCHFSFYKPCCIDADFKYSTSCIDDYLVYDGCEDIATDFNILSDMCNNIEGSSDLFSFIPVHDKQQSANYKNIYCALCRHHRNSPKANRKANFSDVEKFKPWTFTLICKNVIPIYFHAFLSHLFETRFLSNCTFTLVPDICHKRCPTKPAYTKGNTNISWACKNFKSKPSSLNFYYKLNESLLNEYQNIFCAMEETTYNETTTMIQHCNVTGRWNFIDERLQIQCRQLPQIDFHFPYKNIFCKMCNEERVEYVNNFVGKFRCDSGEVGLNDIFFRSLFSFLSYEKQADSLGHGTCEQSQVYDSIKDKCRDIVCYPGRVLINGTCIPLLPYTSNLGYTLTFGVHVQSEAPIKNTRYLLQKMEEEILIQLGRHLNRKMFPFLEMMIMKANTTCSSDVNFIGPYLLVSVFLKLFVNVVVNRDEIETKLLQFQNHEFSFRYEFGCDYCIIKCIVKYDNGSLYLPIDMHIKRFDSTKCYLKTTNMIPESHKYVHSHISSLLQCPQIELDKREVTFDKYRNLLNVPKYSTVLDYYNFYLTRSDHPRICLNTFKGMMVSSSEMIGATDTDFDYLLYQYILICGNMLCNVTKNVAPKIPAYLSTCTECSCDENCIFDGSCCPDIFFSLNLQCTNTSIVSHNYEPGNLFEDSFLMRGTCPEDTDSSWKANCEGNKTLSEKIQFLPVTSSETMITYKNKFCAQCNNESKFEQWLFNSVCDEFVDFNFISSLDEILKTAIDKKCKISSKLAGLNTIGCFRVYGYNTIKTCNVSGSWITYNKDIEWACLNYNNKFLDFKNVFCYICNPPVKVEEVITDCNITGKLFWNEDYPNVQAACNKLGATTSTYPFKNIYCYLCNSIPLQHYINGRRVFMYFDANVSIKEKVENGKYFEYTFEIDSFNAEFRDSYLKTQTNWSSETHLMVNNRVNLTEIYTYYYAMTGNGHFCVNISSIIMADERHNCGCYDSCHFAYKKPCCIDADFKYSTSCIDGYLVYDGCEDIAMDFKILSYKCQNIEESSDLFSSIPVHSEQSNANYKNIYCAMCRNYKTSSKANHKADSFSVFLTFKPWKFILICKCVIPIHFHVFLSHLFETRFLSSCKLTLVPDVCHKRCPIRPDYTKRKTDISWACQNFVSTPTSLEFYNKLNDSSLNKYKNIFCALEDRIHNRITAPIQHCNFTGRWNFIDKLLPQKCRQLPQIDFHLPYKNIFCKMCNEEYKEYINNYVGDFSCSQILAPHYYPVFRSSFSFLSYEEQADSLGQGTCEQSQVYDSIKDKCRDIVCYPGRVLINETCIPLLPYTSNLGYTLTFGVYVQSEAPIKNPQYFLQIMKEEILIQLGRQLNRTIVPFLERMVMKANTTCSSDVNFIGPYLHISIFLKLFVNVVVNRKEIETNLLQFQEKQFSFEHYCFRLNKKLNCMIKCNVKYDKGSLYYLPVDVLFRKFDITKCYLETTNMIPESQRYIHSHISSLLECPQIELDKTEVTIDENNNLLNVPQYSTVLDYHNFFLTRSDLNPRICVTHTIATTPKLKNDDSYQHNSVNLAVYIKIFTITGSSWVIQIIDSFLPLSYFSIIVSLLNALQGVYIFVAYICNKRVFILYRSLICNKPVIRSGSESRNVTKNETYLASTTL
ncbi:unnamed protein product [Mytilus coruscus]|uniref:SMB domain-containing protein n=1 Tax=Mytilus coruscus TaxID=42192 RepID=A0A6J8C289_MYTCO|nr:unnamed protein product [Mytilus coruscus]